MLGRHVHYGCGLQSWRTLPVLCLWSIPGSSRGEGRSFHVSEWMWMGAKKVREMWKRNHTGKSLTTGQPEHRADQSTAVSQALCLLFSLYSFSHTHCQMYPKRTLCNLRKTLLQNLLSFLPRPHFKASCKSCSKNVATTLCLRCKVLSYFPVGISKNPWNKMNLFEKQHTICYCTGRFFHLV